MKNIIYIFKITSLYVFLVRDQTGLNIQIIFAAFPGALFRGLGFMPGFGLGLSSSGFPCRLSSQSYGMVALIADY